MHSVSCSSVRLGSLKAGLGWSMFCRKGMCGEAFAVVCVGG
jgi:hypothetical protein